MSFNGWGWIYKEDPALNICSPKRPFRHEKGRRTCSVPHCTMLMFVAIEDRLVDIEIGSKRTYPLNFHEIKEYVMVVMVFIIVSSFRTSPRLLLV